jgi:hypothetical protein
MTTPILIALLGTLAVGPASAEIYKSRGPDGKVIYSNLLPTGKNTHMTVLAPVDGTAAGPAARAPASDNSGVETLAPEVVGALANVMGMSHLVSSTRDFCVAALPSSFQRYSSVVLGWQQRNAAIVAKKDRVLSISDRNLIGAALNADMLRMTDGMLQPVKHASTPEKIKWCDKTFQDVDRGMLDLVGRASIAPLMNYRIR